MLNKMFYTLFSDEVRSEIVQCKCVDLEPITILVIDNNSYWYNKRYKSNKTLLFDDLENAEAFFAKDILTQL